MGRLTALPSRLGRMPAKLAAPPKIAEDFYSSPEWRALKKAKRAQGRVWCVDCGSNKRLILDHKRERKDGGAELDLVNTEWRCIPCHNRKTAAVRGRRARGEAG